MSDSWRYAIGQQDFKVLREGNAVYVDKTPFIERIVRSNSKYYFLARPRRFGKSLFLSALRYFFEGQRQLFKGLHVDSMDWDWAEYPVLRLDLNMERYAEEGLLDTVLDNIFLKWERKYGVEQPTLRPSPMPAAPSGNSRGWISRVWTPRHCCIRRDI